ncbi:MAG: DUF3426 domain-containing protein [Moraxellaceae bacterium]|nr:DUF3426 domain-containing protein [Moraxellaceae bacterium]
MTDAKQTKCPHCGSSFRISDAQLSAKGGSVRCGSCLQVFRADLHLVGSPTAAPAPAPTDSLTARPKKKSASGDESWALDLIGEKEEKPVTGKNQAAARDWQPGEDNADTFGFDDDEVDSFIDSDIATPAGGSAAKSPLFDDELSDFLEDAGEGLPLGTDNRAASTNENADESWAQSILSELEDEKKKDKKYSMELVDEKKKTFKNPKLAAALGHAPADDDDVFAALGAAPLGAEKKTPANARPADDFLGDDADVLSFLDDDPLGGAIPPPPVAADNNPFSLDRPLAHVDAPVVLKPRREPIDWGHLLTWSFLCLFTIAMFAAQYVYFNFDALAVKPSTRPLFEQTCARFGCRLPEIPDVARLKIADLIVRKHPKVEGALQVDALVKNEAPFAQPFPMLMLRFTNRSDEVVASRLLRPGEYLAGEAALMRRMPPKTPMRISLAIADPGTEALNYSIEPIL